MELKSRIFYYFLPLSIEPLTSSLPSSLPRPLLAGISTLWKGFLCIFKPKSLKNVWGKGRFMKGLGWRHGLGEPEDMERKRREKDTYEWGRVGCNSWMEKVNTTAGGD